MKKLVTSFLLLLILGACATPKVVNVIGPNDNKLTCEELSNEISLLINMQMMLKKQKK